MELVNLRNRTRFYIDDTSQQDFTNADINYAINRAQQEVSAELRQVFEDFFVTNVPYLITTAANQELYPLPSDFIRLKRLERADTGEMVPMIDLNEKSIYGNAVPPLVNTAGYGSGISAYLLGEYLGLTPTPTDNTHPFNLYYVQRLADLVNDTDVTLIPSEYIDLLSILAAVDCMIKDESDTTQLRTLYAEKLDRLKRTARNRQTEMPKYVRRSDFTGTLYPWRQI